MSNLYHRARLVHRNRIVQLFAGKPGRESIVREAQAAIVESLDAITFDDGEDF
jgi:uncharacterized heparinase superfamily protein